MVRAASLLLQLTALGDVTAGHDEELPALTCENNARLTPSLLLRPAAWRRQRRNAQLRLARHCGIRSNPSCSKKFDWQQITLSGVANLLVKKSSVKRAVDTIY
jgi:hypothetical protein